MPSARINWSWVKKLITNILVSELLIRAGGASVHFEWCSASFFIVMGCGVGLQTRRDCSCSNESGGATSSLLTTYEVRGSRKIHTEWRSHDIVNKRITIPGGRHSIWSLFWLRGRENHALIWLYDRRLDVIDVGFRWYVPRARPYTLNDAQHHFLLSWVVASGYKPAETRGCFYPLFSKLKESLSKQHWIASLLGCVT